MPSRKKRVDITSADKQQLGFEFQYLYFMLRLLTMEPGEEVGYEALDDVHTVSSNGITTFIQVKHTLDSTANGDLAALPKLSIDLWKSLSNWAKLIEDPKENRISKTSQQRFINESEFMLIVNRQIQKNPVLLIIKDACNKKLNGTQIKKALKEISASTNDKTIKDYITDVDRLSAGILLKFFQKIRSLKTFFGALTRHISIDRLRKRFADKRGKGEALIAIDELAECIPSSWSMEKAIENKELIQAFNSFLESQPTLDRNLFVARYWYGLPIAEITAKFGIKKNTAVSKLRRSRIRLLAYLEKEDLQ